MTTTTPVQRAISASSAATRRLRGQEILYRRPSEEWTVIVPRAVMGSKNWTTEALYTGVRVGNKPTDWLIAQADLVDSDGELITPQRGDEIETTEGTIYRVMPFGPDDQLWEWHDRDGQTTFRIHTAERDAQ